MDKLTPQQLIAIALALLALSFGIDLLMIFGG